MNEEHDTPSASSFSDQQKKKKFWEESRQLAHKYSRVVFCIYFCLHQYFCPSLTLCLFFGVAATEND